MFEKGFFAGVLESAHPRASLIDLQARQPLVVIISVNQRRYSQLVQHCHAGHINLRVIQLASIQLRGAKIVVGIKRVAIELGVTLDLQMLARVDR